MLTTAYGNPYNYAGYNTGYGNGYGYNAYANAGGYAPSVIPSSVTSNGLGTVNPTNFNAPEVLFAPQDSVQLSFNAQQAGPANYGVQDTLDIRFANPMNRIGADAFVVAEGDIDNPYQNHNAAAIELPVANGQNPKEALMEVLQQLGITVEMLQALLAMGIDLLQMIAQTNGVKDFSQLKNGQDLILPTTWAPTESSTGSTNSGSVTANSTPARTPAPAAPAPAPAPAAPAAPQETASTPIRRRRGGGRGMMLAV